MKGRPQNSVDATSHVARTLNRKQTIKDEPNMEGFAPTSCKEASLHLDLREQKKNDVKDWLFCS